MTREEANKQFLKILDEYIAEKKEIFADAQKKRSCFARIGRRQGPLHRM